MSPDTRKMLATAEEFSPFLADLFKVSALYRILKLVGTGFDRLSCEGQDLDNHSINSGKFQNVGFEPKRR